MIYLDNAATTYPKPECVYQELDRAQRSLAFNAGRGSYPEAENANSVIESTRKILCEYANAKELVFTSSATQAINNIVNGLDLEEGDIVYCSPYDHNAIARTLYAKKIKNGIDIKLIPLNEDNSIDLDQLKFNCIIDKPKAIFSTHISNVTGYILPIREIGEIASINKSIFVVDGAQAFGLVPVDIVKDNISYYIFAGHKTMYGPFGIAGYLCNKNELKITYFGGTGSDSLNLDMPVEGHLRYEPSSPNSVAIAGLKKGFEWVRSINCLKHEVDLSKYLINKLKKMDDVIIYNDEKATCCGIVSFNLKTFSSEDVAKILSNDFDICVRGGYHCSPFIHDFLETKKFQGTIRVSVGYFNTIEDIKSLCLALEEIIYES